MGQENALQRPTQKAEDATHFTATESRQVNPILVIAGHYREFLEWCRENRKNPQDRRECRYIATAEDLYGWDKPTLVFYGTYLNRSDWDAIHDRAQYLV